MSCRLAIVATHPIQYFSPWFRDMAHASDVSLRVFYLWDFGVGNRVDPGFGRPIRWDIPLLSGYEHEFVPNRSRCPGTSRTMGLWNPDLAARLRAWRPDVVLLMGYNFASLLHLIFFWRDGRVPLLFRGDSHRIVLAQGFREAMRRKLISLVFRRFSAFLYVGSANKDYFRHHGVPEHKLFYAPHAVENERFFDASTAAVAEAREWRRSLGIPDANQVILFAGKFEPKKRPLDLLAAFASAGLENASLLFVGSGELEDALRSAARTNPAVFFAPFQNQTQMPRVYAAADLFVLPSYGRSETWGLAVNEAMCMGLPVIASDHVGCARDLVMPRRNGLTFPAGDVTALAASLREAMADMARLKAWGSESRRMIAQYSHREATAGLRRAIASLALPERAPAA